MPLRSIKPARPRPATAPAVRCGEYAPKQRGREWTPVWSSSRNRWIHRIVWEILCFCFSAAQVPRREKTKKVSQRGYFLHCVLVWSVNRKPYGLPGACGRSLGQRRSRTGLTTMFFVPAPVGRYVFSVFSLPSLIGHTCLPSRCIRHGRPLAACRARYPSPFATVPATRWRRPGLFVFPVAGEDRLHNRNHYVNILVA